MQDNQQNKNNQLLEQKNQSNPNYNSTQINTKTNTIPPQNVYVLPPQTQSLGDKLIIPFSSCGNCVLEILQIIAILLIIILVPKYAKMYTSVFFLIEQFCFFF